MHSYLKTQRENICVCTIDRKKNWYINTFENLLILLFY